jgi:hypothetical protein
MTIRKEKRLRTRNITVKTALQYDSEKWALRERYEQNRNI